MQSAKFKVHGPSVEGGTKTSLVWTSDFGMLFAFTPKGMKIRIEIPVVFALISRLWHKNKKIDAGYIFETAEGISFIPEVLGYFGALTGLFWGKEWWVVAVGLTIGKTVGKLIISYGFFIIPGLPSLGKLWGRIGGGYGVLTMVGFILSWYLKGVYFALSWIAGLIVSYILCDWIIEMMRMNHFKEKFDHPITNFDINFYNAFRLIADRLEIDNKSLFVSDEELADDFWKDCLEDYIKKNPQAMIHSNLES